MQKTINNPPYTFTKRGIYYFTHLFLHTYRISVLYMELHEYVDDAETKVGALIEQASKMFAVEFVREPAIDIASYPELDCYDSSTRLLALSEGHRTAMRWLKLTPQNSAQSP